MSTDALAALLMDWLARDGVEEELFADAEWSRVLADYLAARGVVVLPADHPLRTGEPSEAMDKALRLAIWKAATFTKADLNTPEGRSALALNAAASAGRAALAVLREPLDK